MRRACGAVNTKDEAFEVGASSSFRVDRSRFTLARAGASYMKCTSHKLSSCRIGVGQQRQVFYFVRNESTSIAYGHLCRMSDSVSCAQASSDASSST